MEVTAEPLPASAWASAAASVGHEDWDPRPGSRAWYSSPGPAPGPPDTERGCARLRWMRPSRAVVGSPAGRHGHPASAAHQAKNERSSDSKLIAWSVTYRTVSSAGSMAPSSTMARTWVGNNPA